VKQEALWHVPIAPNLSINTADISHIFLEVASCLSSVPRWQEMKRKDEYSSKTTNKPEGGFT
jgi:hypothetical protein